VGVSTNAVLFYGYCWTDDDVAIFENAPEVEDGEWVVAVLKRRGVVDPWDAYVEPSRGIPYYEQQRQTDAWTEAHRAELDAWHAAQRAVEEEFGVEVDSHCSGDYPIPYLCTAQVIARRGDAEEITPERLTVDPTWAGKLDRFMAEFGIEKPHESPRWWLVSYWG
jgi:hypothetical protein